MAESYFMWPGKATITQGAIIQSPGGGAGVFLKEIVSDGCEINNAAYFKNCSIYINMIVIKPKIYSAPPSAKKIFLRIFAVLESTHCPDHIGINFMKNGLILPELQPIENIKCI